MAENVSKMHFIAVDHTLFYLSQFVCSSMTCPECRRPAKENDLRRLFLNNILSQLRENEQIIATLHQLNEDLGCESEKKDAAFKDEVKENMERVSCYHHFYCYQIIFFGHKSKRHSLILPLQVFKLEMELKRIGAEKDKLLQGFQSKSDENERTIATLHQLNQDLERKSKKNGTLLMNGVRQHVNRVSFTSLNQKSV